MSQMKTGDPMCDDTTVGAMISEQQAQEELGYIQDARKQGANSLCGGERVSLPSPFDKGWFLSPAVVTDVSDDMTIVQEELFGPVACILPFDTEEEAIRRANDCQFGLEGGVFTRDLSRAHRVSQQIQAGNIYINNYNMYPPQLPFGGNKKSGI